MGFAVLNEKECGGSIPHKIYYEFYVAFMTVLMFSDRLDFHNQMVRLIRRKNITLPLTIGYQRDMGVPNGEGI